MDKQEIQNKIAEKTKLKDELTEKCISFSERRDGKLIGIPKLDHDPRVHDQLLNVVGEIVNLNYELKNL